MSGFCRKRNTGPKCLKVFFADQICLGSILYQKNLVAEVK